MTMNPTREQRSWERFYLKVAKSDSACGILAHGALLKAKIHNVSLGGVCFELPITVNGRWRTELHTDDEVEFLECHLEKWGQFINGSKAFVRWVDGNLFGCQFYQPLGIVAGQ